MRNKFNGFNEFITKDIISNNRFGIESVLNTEDITSIYFKKGDYAKIEELIKQGDIEALRNLPLEQTGDEIEYVYIIKFEDQSSNFYIATIYDSIELWQDPQLIEIYPLLNTKAP